MNYKNISSEISHKKVWLLAGPIILSNISVPLVGAVDTAVMGHLGKPEYIGAIAIGALIFSFLYWGFGFLRMATTGFIAQFIGSGDRQSLSDTILRVLSLGLILGLLIILLARPMIELVWLAIETSSAVESLASEYARLRIFSAPAVLMSYAITGILIGMHNTKAAFIMQLALNLINITLDIVFVMGLGWGVEGVAIASVIAEYTAMFIGLYLLRKAILVALNQLDFKRLLEASALKSLFSTNINIFIRTLCLIWVFAYLTAQSAKMGEVVLAATAILMQLNSMASFALDGFAHAVEALAGTAYGGGNLKSFRRAILLTSIWSLVSATVICLIYLVFGDSIIGLFTNIDVIVDTAIIYLAWIALLPLISAWGYQLDGIFIGTSHTREMRNAMVVSALVYALLLKFTVPLWGTHGLFIALVIFTFLRALTLIYYFPNIEKAIVAIDLEKADRRS